MQLREQKQKLDKLDVHVLVITFEEPAVAAAYERDLQVPWPLLLDTTRHQFGAYGMVRGSLWKVMGPKNWWSYLKLLLLRRRVRRPTGDVYQLGGDVLIDPVGIVRLHHITTTSTDRPPVESLLEIVRGQHVGQAAQPSLE